MRRPNIYGDTIMPETTIEKPQRTEPWCRACGMPLTSWDEFHPKAACDLYRETQDAALVRAEMETVPHAMR